MRMYIVADIRILESPLNIYVLKLKARSYGNIG